MREVLKVVWFLINFIKVYCYYGNYIYFINVIFYYSIRVVVWNGEFIEFYLEFLYWDGGDKDKYLFYWIEYELNILWGFLYWY